MGILMLIGIITIKYPELVVALLIILGALMLSLRKDDRNVDR